MKLGTTIVNIRSLYVVLVLLLGGSELTAQVKISEDNVTVDSSAMLEVESTTKGFLPPRMTSAERDSINNPTAGLMIYCIDCMEMQMYNDTAWTNLMGLPTNDPWQCGDQLLYEGQDYNTVLLGNQCWMAENLNVGTMISGDLDQTDNGIFEKYCYDEITASCDTFGGLYQWNEMMQYTNTISTQGICPLGWHLPSDDEFKALEMELGMSQATANQNSWRGTDQGSQMAKDEIRWYDGDLDQNSAFDSSGFAGLPTGQVIKLPMTIYANNGYGSYFWTSDEGDGVPGIDPTAWHRYLYYHMSSVHRSVSDKIKGYSVRCLQN